MSQEKTKEELQSELQARIKGFNEKFMPLLGEFKLGLGAQPLLVPSKDTALGYVIAARPIETKLQVIEKQSAIKGPRPRGFIVEPESEAEQVRQKIIERNRKAGRDTPISELR